MPSVSKKQQKFMGIVRSIQKGEAPAGKFSKAAQDAAKKMKKSSVKKYAKTKHDDLPTKKEGVQKDRNELSLHIIDLNNMLGQARLSKNPKAKKYIKLIQKDLKDARKKLSKLKEERDYKAEYKKFQSSTKAKKYRAELNKYNRQKGTYGNGDGKDASHKGGKIVGFEAESKNRGRAEKSRLKKEANMPDFNPMIDKALDEVIEEYTMARKNVIDKIATLAKANKYGTVDGTQMNGKTAKQIIAIYNHPKMKKFKKAMADYSADDFVNLTIKLPKVLGIKVESVNEAGMELKKLEDAIKFFKKKIEKQGRVTNARDEEHLERLMKVYNDMGGRKIKENSEPLNWLQEKCWKGYEKKGMKTMFGKRYPNCVKKTKKEGVNEAPQKYRVYVKQKAHVGGPASKKFSVEKFQTGGMYFDYKKGMDTIKKLRKMNSSADYKLVKEGVNENSAEKSKILKLMIKYGDNPKDAKRDLAKHYKKAKGDRSKATPSQLAQYIGFLSANESVNEEIEMSKGVKKLMKIADTGFAKVGGVTVDGMSANLFKQIYNKANDDIKQKLNTKNEKQLVRILGGMWQKFGKNVTIGSSL